MNKREFDAEIKRLKKLIDDSYDNKAKVIKEFQLACPHQVRYLECERVDAEDEYGKWIDSWTTYTYTCKRCGAEIDRIKPKQFETDNDIRVALKAKVETTK